MLARYLSGLTALQLAFGAATATAAEPIHHTMSIALDPAAQTITVVDRIELNGADAEFIMSSALLITDSSSPVQSMPLGDATQFFGINASEGASSLERYRIAGGKQVITLHYSGRIDHGLSDEKEQYTRGFRETSGIVDERGVYLAGNGFWYPHFSDGLLSFEIDIAMPDGWQVISQGDGTARDEAGHARWHSSDPMDEIYLVGGPLLRYTDQAGAVEAQVYLHEADDALANRYLSTTGQYLEMYRSLLGPYPYSKFALVENFWETGYGMPSFTLLGPTVIRFPFILHSSYPHEILHNWWGNSVFVDYETGNWCEGLTAYMADHLVQEQRGTGALFRRASLQKYRDFVKEGRDFPLTEFRSRHSAATEAVGYGKTLMGFHMLRQRVGDEQFLGALTRFYRSNKGSQASFSDLQSAFEAVSKEDLESFFEQWVQRPGAAALRVKNRPKVIQGGTRYRGDPTRYPSFAVRGALTQQQDQLYSWDVPVVVQTESGRVDTRIRLEGRETGFKIMAIKERPLALHVDPDFDVFRQLDPRETPTSIGQIFGEPEILAVLPGAADRKRLEDYRTLMNGWQSDSHHIELRLDSELEELPGDRAIWIIGRENRFRPVLFEGANGIGAQVSADRLTVADQELGLEDHAAVVIRRHPENIEKAIGFLSLSPRAALQAFAGKLPHYGKYSYLGFEGAEATNVLKGEWAATDSPMIIDLRPEEGRAEALPPLPPATRIALAELPPAFSQSALLQHVAWLAAPEREGRGVGTAGLEASADYIAERFAEYGLQPAGDDGGYMQRFTVSEGPEGIPVEAMNVIGFLPAAREDWSDQATLISAHYDHLGRGWPDARQAYAGRIHPGADDNASGVSVLLELAKNIALSTQPSRNLVFAAFSAEEAGLLGSKYYVEHSMPTPLSGIRNVINLDTIGRLGDAPLQVLGTGTADEWQHVFRSVSFVTGVDSRNVAAATGGSDQMSFIERGIPGVQLFATAHGDYHAPGDTHDKIDGPGLVKIATFVKESLAYLTEREEPLSITIENAPPTAAAPRANASGRRVSLGTVPEFGYQGTGVQIAQVVDDSPAARAGVQSGDVVIAIDEQAIRDLQGYSDTLKTLEPEQIVVLTVLRDGTTHQLSVTVTAR